MNILKALFGLLKKAFSLAQEAGLTDELVGIAKDWAKMAEEKFLDNNDKREFVVKMLMAKGVPQGVARLATELGVRLLKSEEEKLMEKVKEVKFLKKELAKKGI